MSTFNPETSSRADFFVHPDYHRLTGGQVTEELQRYETALYERIEKSCLPILIHDAHSRAEKGDFWDLFPPDHRFPTRFGSGTLMPGCHDTQAALNELLDERKVVEGIVHGSYLAQCVQTFRGKLRALQNGVIYYDRSVHRPGPVGAATSTDNASRTIRFGLVLKDHTRTNPDFHAPAPGAVLPPEYTDDAQIFCTGITDDRLASSK